LSGHLKNANVFCDLFLHGFTPKKLGLVASSGNRSTQEAEREGLRVQGQPGLHRETSKKKIKQNKTRQDSVLATVSSSPVVLEYIPKDMGNEHTFRSSERFNHS
jgi:hypothetical protein